MGKFFYNNYVIIAIGDIKIKIKKEKVASQLTVNHFVKATNYLTHPPTRSRSRLSRELSRWRG